MEEKKNTRKKTNVSKKKTQKAETSSKRKPVTTKSLEQKEKTFMDAKKEKKGIKEVCSSMPFLCIVFLLLLVLVIVLSVLVYQKDKEMGDAIHSNMHIPITKVEDRFQFHIDSLALSESEEYVFRISNYKENTVNSVEIPYTITIENSTNAVLKITKGEDSKNLMENQAVTVISGEVLPKDKKEDVYYHVTVTNHGELGLQDLIQITVTS